VTEETPSDLGGHGDGGYTLIELLVAIAILGIAFVSLLGALGMSIVGSDIHKQQSQVESVIDSAAEKLKDPTAATGALHVACATTSQSTYVAAAQSAAASQGWAASTVQITSIQYWDGSGFGATCYDDAAHNNLNLQLITLTVTNPGTRASQSIAFVKR
jgi:prepilin-type N-terminal cleavage/methylation domain-containing protein